MNCRNNQSYQLQALENGVLKLWDELARAKAKANADNNNRVNNLLSKVDELAILIMEMNDVDQKFMCSYSSLVFTERRPSICQPAPVIQFPALPSQTPSYIEEYPDLAVIIAALFVLFIAYQMFKFILGLLSVIFRRPC